MYENQTAAHARRRRRQFTALADAWASPLEMLLRLDTFVDPSDPDTALPNSEHAYQAAAMARRLRPDDPYFQVAALIHDIGKVLLLPDGPAPDHEPWETVGDTFIVGEPLPTSSPCYDSSPLHARKQARMYPVGCGLRNVDISWGHDEYLFRVLEGNAHLHSLPPEYCQAIRLHSLYPWHTDGAYRHLMDARDRETLPLVNDLNQCDLYSKNDVVVDETARLYFNRLLEIVFPHCIAWAPAHVAVTHAAL